MDGTKFHWDWATFLSAMLVSLVTSFVVETVVVVRWTGGIEEKIHNVELGNKVNQERLAQIDVAGSRNVPVLQEKLKTLEKSDESLQSRLTATIDRLNTVDERLKALRDISDQRQNIVNRAAQGFEDIAVLKEQNAKTIERLNIVEGLIRQLLNGSATRRTYEDRW